MTTTATSKLGLVTVGAWFDNNALSDRLNRNGQNLGMLSYPVGDPDTNFNIVPGEVVFRLKAKDTGPSQMPWVFSSFNGYSKPGTGEDYNKLRRLIANEVEVVGIANEGAEFTRNTNNKKPLSVIVGGMADLLCTSDNIKYGQWVAVEVPAFDQGLPPTYKLVARTKAFESQFVYRLPEFRALMAEGIAADANDETLLANPAFRAFIEALETLANGKIGKAMGNARKGQMVSIFIYNFAI